MFVSGRDRNQRRETFVTAAPSTVDPSTSLPRLAVGPVIADGLGTPYRPFRFFSTDGLALAGRDYAPATASDRRPVVCLPGLTRNARDFEPVIARLVAARDGKPSRRVVTFDFRGRGASQYSPDAATYTPLQEFEDTRLGLSLLGIARITAFGTSRGGMVTMLSSLLAPGLVEAAVLNDIGPVIDLAGLLRIKGYVGKPIAADIDWETLVTAMMHVNRSEYPRLDRAAFERFAHRLFKDVGGRPALDYDPALAVSLTTVDENTSLPDLWVPFEGLAAVPTLVVRGSLSDLLSTETVAAMQARHPRCEAIEVADEGHAPLFDDPVSQDALLAWLDRVGA